MIKVATAYNGRLVGTVTDGKGSTIPYADVEVVRAEDAENSPSVSPRSARQTFVSKSSITRRRPSTARD